MRQALAGELGQEPEQRLERARKRLSDVKATKFDLLVL